jgi:hypothetical protein
LFVQDLAGVLGFSRQATVFVARGRTANTAYHTYRTC